MRLPDGTLITYVCEVGHPSETSTSVYDTAQYNTDRYDGSDITWDFIEARILDFSTRAGKDSFGKRYRTGTALINVDNKDGVFGNLAEPGDWIRLYLRYEYDGGALTGDIANGATWTGVTGRTWTANGNDLSVDAETDTGFVNMFYGRIDSTRDIVKNGVDVTRLRCVDIFADLAAFNGAAQPAAGAGENTKDRITRILGNVGTGIVIQQEFGTPAATMQATTLADQALSEIQLTMDSEGGDVWPAYFSRNNGGGDLNVGYRDWLTEAPRSTELQYLFGVSGGIELIDGQVQRELQLVVNDATFATTGGTAQNATDGFSIQRYGKRTYRRLDLICEGDTQPLFLANRVVNNLAVYRPRVRQVTINVEDFETIEMFSDIQFGDLIIVAVRSINGWATAYQTHVSGISREGYGLQLMITLDLDDAFVRNENGPFSYEAFDDSYSLGGQPETTTGGFP